MGCVTPRYQVLGPEIPDGWRPTISRPPGVASCACSAWLSRCSSVSLPIGLPSHLLAQQTGRTEHEHPDQHGERDDRLPLNADARHPEVLDHPQEQASHHGAPDVADPAQDGRREGLDPGQEAEVELRLPEADALE